MFILDEWWASRKKYPFKTHLPYKITQLYRPWKDIMAQGIPNGCVHGDWVGLLSDPSDSVPQHWVID